ncbi:MAG: polysaccharide biosynthesis protein [Clostridia bacterium]|nr:polysaccharide biosynthesis protein [Clostridia bacterium]
MELHTTVKRPSFLSGAGILTLSALTVKVIGLFYRIPLLHLLGTEGMGYFNTAYELYALFCVISTAGLPVAMSVLIATLEAEGKKRDAGRVFRVSLALFAGVGCVGTLLLWGLSAPFATLLGSPLSAACMRAISPTVFFICLSSAFRGYFQGRRSMLPTAISQVMEAAGKLFLGLAFAGIALSRGEALPVIAAYAVMGLTVGTALSVVYLYGHKKLSDRGEIDFLASRRDADLQAWGSSDPSIPAKVPVLRPLLATAIPVTLSAGLMSFTKCIDLALILRRLQAVGYTATEATALYGCYSTLAVPVFNILPSLTTSVALSATPALSAALKKGGEGVPELQKTAFSALRITLILAMPAALGISVFAEDILTLLFRGQPEAVAQATPWLSCLGLSVPAACLTTVTGAMLQAAGKAQKPIISMLLGVGAKIITAYILLGRDGWGMAGAPVSSLLCDTVIVVCNLIFIARYAPAMLPTLRQSMPIVAIPSGMAVGAVALTKLLRSLSGGQIVTPLHTVATVACVACLYGAGMLIALLLGKRLPMNKKEGTTS